VLAYLRAVANEFIRNQWEGKRVNTDNYFSDYGDRGKRPSFCCKGFFVICLNCGFMLMSIFSATVRSVPSAITCDRPCSVDA
jgi:hypothetical protein